jgi:hypothetical protein
MKPKSTSTDGWIDIKKVRPDSGQRVLAADVLGDVFEAQYQPQLFDEQWLQAWGFRRWSGKHDSALVTYVVTHWKPLPEHPELKLTEVR